MKLPVDPTPEELEIYEVMLRRTCNIQGTAHLYALIDDPLDKFIMAFVFEMGHTQKSCQIAAGRSKAAIWARIKRIKRRLEDYGITNRLLQSVDTMSV
jgi:hypothetical protein